MKEEDNLYKKVGKENPFKVPEGYFEDFSRKLMEQLPDKEFSEPHITVWERVKPWAYMAAMFVGLMFSVRMFMDVKEKATDALPHSEAVSEWPDEELDPIIHQTMLNDYELYQYLSEADMTFNN